MKRRTRPSLLLLLVLSLCAVAAVPVHSNMGRTTLLGYIADSLSLAARGTATIPTAPPVHRNMGETQLLGYIADYAQTLNTYTVTAAADGTTDMRATIQAALDTAGAAGGGVVQLKEGVYRIITVNAVSPAGAYGLEIPSNVMLCGMGDATVLRAVAGGDFGTGGVLCPKGFRTATTDYGASSNVILRNFKVESEAQVASTGNLLNIVYASDWLVENVNIGSCYYHGVELCASRRITFRRCRWTGDHTWGASGNPVQFDYGDAGPRGTGGASKTISDVLFEQCRFIQRPAGQGSVREIELMHDGSGLQLQRITFRECEFHGKAQAYTYIADVGTGISISAGGITDLLFERCIFNTYHYQSYGFQLYQNTDGALFNGIRFRGCTFNVKGYVVWAVGNSSATTAYNNRIRRNFEFSGNVVNFDKTGFPLSLWSVYEILVNQWDGAVIRDNLIRDVGDFPAGHTVLELYIVRAAQNWDVDVSNNRIEWSGNNAAGSNPDKVGFGVDCSVADTSGYTRRMRVENNVVDAVTANFKYGVRADRGATQPANSICIFSGNWSNAASTGAASGAFIIGPVSGAGPLSFPQRTVTANTTATFQDGVINCDTTAGSITITPPAALHRSTLLLIKTATANSLICGSTTLTGKGMILVWGDNATQYTQAFSTP